MFFHCGYITGISTRKKESTRGWLDKALPDKPKLWRKVHDLGLAPLSFKIETR